MQLFARDPGTWTCAAISGWDHPVSRESLVLMDLFDLNHGIAIGKAPQPHPGRPQAKRGTVEGRTAAEVIALLRPPV